MNTPKRKVLFRFRAFVSLTVALSFFVMVVSGIILYLAPSRRLAEQQDWSVCGLFRSQWIALHLSFSTLFLIAAVIHLWFNRRPLLSYLKLKRKTAAGLRWEWAAVLLAAVWVAWGTLAPFGPFTALLEQRQQFYRGDTTEADSQSDRTGMGQMTLADYCRQTGQDADSVIDYLNAQGIAARKNDTLRAISDRNDIRPSRLRSLIETARP